MVFRLCLYLLLVGLALVNCAEENHIQVLTDSDFEDGIRDMDTVLVMFFAPWCGHCKRMKPELEKAAEILKENDPPVPVAKVDCTDAGKDTCSKFGVSGYPTLKIFRGGEFSQEYSGPRETNGIVKYMKAQVGPSSKELKSASDVETFLDTKDVTVISFLDDDTEFQKVAGKLRESVRFGHTSDKDAAKKYGAENKLALFRPKHLQTKFEKAVEIYSGKSDKDSMNKWVKATYHGICGHRTTDNAEDFKAPLVVAYYSVDYIKNTKGTNYWRNRIMKVAQDFTSDFTFGVSAVADFQHELEEYGKDYVAGDKPVVCARDKKNQKFVMEAEFTMDTFKQYLKDMKDGNLAPYIKSEPVPESNDAGVKVAVGKNFQELVTDNDKDILIEFYAPWCGHCKKLAPVFDELGEKMKDEPEVEIVKMDATANDVSPPFEVRGFPTLFWVPKGEKSNPMKYEGGRELNDFVEYIAKHATNELKGYNRKGKPKKTEL